jgi:hypothetical protein
MKNLVLVLVGAMGCGVADAGDTGEPSDTSSGGSSTSADTGSDSTGGTDVWPPETCALAASPFLDADCLDALRVACNAHAAETQCTAAEPLSFDSGGYSIRCAWAEVITFTDAASCAGATISERCEAILEQFDGVSFECTAIPSALEIVVLSGGPLGPWSAVESDDDDVGPCAPNVQPPAPALCDCAPASCDPV